MILILSNIANEAAPRLAEMFQPGAAHLLTASSFHKQFRGSFDLNHFSASHFKIDGIDLTTADITGVISTITCFIPEEFYYIEEADRKYVCAEMNAFFIWFLSQLNCRKINPSTASSFSGGVLHKIEWIKYAKRAGVPVWPVTLVNGRPVRKQDDLTHYTCSMLGDSVIGNDTPEEIKNHLFALRRVLDVPYLGCSFAADTEGKFYLTDVRQKPDISTMAVREAILNYFA